MDISHTHIHIFCGIKALSSFELELLTENVSGTQQLFYVRNSSQNVNESHTWGTKLKEQVCRRGPLHNALTKKMKYLFEYKNQITFLNE